MSRLTPVHLLVPAAFLATACASVPLPPDKGPARDAAVTVSGDSVHLRNTRVIRSFVVRNGAPRTAAVSNRLTGVSELRLDGAVEFAISLRDGRRWTDADCEAGLWWYDVLPDGRAALHSIFRRADAGLTVEVVYEAGRADAWMRKRLLLTCDAAAPLPVDRIELDRFRPAHPAQAHDGPGQPVYIDDFFLGCEYPEADNVVKNGEVSLGYASGVDLAGGPHATRAAVLGAGPREGVRDAFFGYLSEVRAVRRRPWVAFDARYDLHDGDVPQLVASIRGASDALAAAGGPRPDAYVPDDGWDDPENLWRVHPRRFPHGLAPVADAARGAGGAIGACFPLSAGSGFEDRRKWGVAQGLEPLAPDGRGFCPAAPNCRRRLQDAAREFLRDGGASCFFFDRLPAACADPAHGHRVGPYAGPAMTDALLDLIHGIREERPDVFIGLASGCRLSPWWLLEADAVGRGGDAIGFASVPPGAPRRERWITHVDAVLYDQLRARERQFPLAAIMTGGVILGRVNPDAEAAGTVGAPGDPPEAWRHDVIMNAARGGALHEICVSPSAATPAQWETLARWTRWSLQNAARLPHAEMAGGDPAKGEPYAFVHTGDGVAVVVARNPVDAPRTLSLPCDRRTLGLSLGQMALWTQIHPKIEKGAVNEGETLALDLAPFEVRVLELRALGTR